MRRYIIKGLLVWAVLLAPGCGARTGLEVDGAVVRPIGTPNNAYGCLCTCTGDFSIGTETTEFLACLPPEINPGLHGAEPTPEQLETDCTERVINTAAFFYHGQSFGCDMFERETCTCTVSRAAFMGAENCSVECPNIPLDWSLPGSIKEATSVPFESPCGTSREWPGSDLRPVCRVPGGDPPEPIPEGAFSNFIAHSEGHITGGQAIITIDGQPRRTNVRGDASIVGTPCPGSSCGVNVALRFEADPVEIGSFLGLADVRVERITAGVAGTPGVVVLDAAGHGQYPLVTMQAWGRGTAVERVLGVPTSETTQAFLLTNTSPVDIDVGWNAKTFAVRDEFSVIADDGTTESSVVVAVQVEGVLDNQPPTARVTAPSVVECTSPDGASFSLDSSASSDPDGNIVSTMWWLDRPHSGTFLAFDPSISIQQALGTTETYWLIVSDARFQPAQASAQVAVVDTTAPQISTITVTPDCLWPPNRKFFRFDIGEEIRGALTDVCDTNALLRLVDVRSSEPGASGIIFGESGVCLRSERTGAGTGREYTLVLEAEDQTGNTTTAEVVVRVPRDEAGECSAINPSEMIDARDAPRLCQFDAVTRSSANTPRRPYVITSTETAPASARTGGGCSVQHRRTNPAPVLVTTLVLASIFSRRKRRST